VKSLNLGLPGILLDGMKPYKVEKVCREMVAKYLR
jgi:TPP-dependent pyruvate/acetoin dehydrogenase alpha subunit